MNIVVMGQGDFGAACLQALVEKGKTVVGVFAPPQIPGKKAKALGAAAEKLGIPVFPLERMREQKAYGDFTSLSPDLSIMAYVNDIIPGRIIDYPRIGTIHYHPSLLPKHRGRSSINWAVINGDTKGGLSIIWADEGIDTGPILLQKEVEISPDDSTGSVYFNKLFPMGVDAVVEAVELIEKGVAPRIPQDDSQATYEPPCTEEKVIIDWSQPAQKVYNLIRGANPQPGAVAYLKGTKVKIFDCEPRPELRGENPGEIVETSDQGFSISTGEGSILVKRVQPEGSAKISAPEYVQLASLKVGDRFDLT